MAKSPHLSKHLAAIMELSVLINEKTSADCFVHYYPPTAYSSGLHLSVYPAGYDPLARAKEYAEPWDILTEDKLCQIRRHLVDLYQEKTGDKLWNLLP